MQKKKILPSKTLYRRENFEARNLVKVDDLLCVWLGSPQMNLLCNEMKLTQ